MNSSYALVPVFACLLLIPVSAKAQNCVVVGGDRAPVEIRIYDENEVGGLGRLLYDGMIERQQKIPLTVSKLRFRYEYRVDARDSWSPSKGESCQRGERKLVP